MLRHCTAVARQDLLELRAAVGPLTAAALVKAPTQAPTAAAGLGDRRFPSPTR
ncbi:hypothetical protein ACH47C_16295 [Streptomyces rishiriensis]|uniref:hypothetical protein n=1 Tax=Streptomyces rishiriensis TaxID=68264 RepID=UPI0033CBB390